MTRSISSSTYSSLGIQINLSLMVLLLSTNGEPG